MSEAILHSQDYARWCHMNKCSVKCGECMNDDEQLCRWKSIRFTNESISEHAARSMNSTRQTDFHMTRFLLLIWVWIVMMIHRLVCNLCIQHSNNEEWTTNHWKVAHTNRKKIIPIKSTYLWTTESDQSMSRLCLWLRYPVPVHNEQLIQQSWWSHYQRWLDSFQSHSIHSQRKHLMPENVLREEVFAPKLLVAFDF